MGKERYTVVVGKLTSKPQSIMADSKSHSFRSLSLTLPGKSMETGPGMTVTHMSTDREIRVGFSLIVAGIKASLYLLLEFNLSKAYNEIP